IPLFTLLLAPVIVNMFYAVIGFIVVMLFAGQIPVFATLSLIPLMLVQCILTLAIISFLSILRVFFADTGRLLEFALRAWWFLSPILYHPSFVLESQRAAAWMKELFMLNPFTTLIPAYRAVLLEGNQPNWEHVGLLGLFSVLLLIVGSLFFQNYERRLVKFL
ncbi:MAG: hypothetical protein MJA83_03025, partial [Gammaproteobacteria bacterium]|nr:hypothetical protein [Gammaproteobacteria bacterium]